VLEPYTANLNQDCLLILTYFTSDQIGEESVDVVLHQFWEIDSSGVRSLPVMTAEDKLVLDKVQRSIEFVNGHYQVAIPWREDRLTISNNYEMAFKRLQKLEKHLQINPKIAVAYKDTIVILGRTCCRTTNFKVVLTSFSSCLSG